MSIKSRRRNRNLDLTSWYLQILQWVFQNWSTSLRKKDSSILLSCWTKPLKQFGIHMTTQHIAFQLNHWEAMIINISMTHQFKLQQNQKLLPYLTDNFSTCADRRGKKMRPGPIRWGFPNTNTRWTNVDKEYWIGFGVVPKKKMKGKDEQGRFWEQSQPTPKSLNKQICEHGEYFFPVILSQVDWRAKRPSEKELRDQEAQPRRRDHSMSGWEGDKVNFFIVLTRLNFLDRGSKKQREGQETWWPMMSIALPENCFPQEQGIPRKEKSLQNFSWLWGVWCDWLRMTSMEMAQVFSI